MEGFESRSHLYPLASTILIQYIQLPMQENLLYYIIMFISNDSAVQSNNKCQAIDNCHVKSCFIFQNRKYRLYLWYQPNFWMTGSNGRVRVFQSLIGARSSKILSLIYHPRKRPSTSSENAMYILQASFLWKEWWTEKESRIIYL